MEGTTEQWVIPEGMQVIAADGAKVGKVVANEGDYLVVEKGWLFPTDYYVPVGAVGKVDDDAVYLALTKDEALHQQWDTVPTVAVAPVRTPATTEDRLVGTIGTARTVGWPPSAHADYDLLTGKDVYSAGGDKVGTIKGVYHPAGAFAAGLGRHYILLDPGLLRDWFGGYDKVYVPESAIATVTSERVDLNLTKDQIKGQGWTTRPADLDAYRWA